MLGGGQSSLANVELENCSRLIERSLCIQCNAPWPPPNLNMISNVMLLAS